MKDKKENILNLNGSSSNDGVENLQGILANIFSLFITEIKPKLIACFEALDDSLFNLAEKSDTNSKQSSYFDSMKHIRKSRNIILKDFFNCIQSTFTSFKKNELDYVFNNKNETNNKNEPQKKPLGLSLLDDNELDEALAISNLISKSEMAYKNHIFAFEKRFSVLASQSDIESNQIPISPFVIVNSFNQSLKKVDLDVNIKLIFYKIYERTVIGQLNGIYNKINELFISKGVVPKINYNLANGINNSFQPQHINNLPDQTQVIDNETSDISQENQIIQDQNVKDQNYQLISELFSQNYNNNNDYSQLNSNNNNNNLIQKNIGLNSVLNALSILQSQVFTNSKSDNDSNQSPIDMKDSIIDQLKKLDGNTVNQRVKSSDEDTINLVGMLFQFIIDDRNLPETIQVLLAKLQIPYLKIALENKNLFSDRTHPARVLLNNLSQASVGWSKDSDYKMQFLSKIEDITHKILEVDTYENVFFIDLNNAFDLFLKKQKKISDIRQKRTTEKNLGQEKVDLAKKTSAKLLLTEMLDREMPLLIKDILLSEWSNVLNLTHLRFSVDSFEYKERVAFIKRVIKFSTVNNETQATVNDLFKVANTYGDGLNFLAFNPIDIRAKQRNLVKCLSNINKLGKNASEKKIEILAPDEVLDISEIKKYKNEVVNYIEDIINPEPEPESQEEVEVSDKYIEIVSSFKTGTWVEIDRSDKPPIRAKLSWISPITGMYLFVNSRGLKITDKNSNELAIGLQNKSIRILQQEEIFDRALSSIANQMQTDK